MGDTMTANEAARLVAILAAAYPQWPASKETVAIYRDLLGDLDYDSVLDAVRALIATEHRWPTVADIRRRCAAADGVLPPSGAQAWLEVHEAVSVGCGGPWSHPAVEQTVQAIGLWELRTDTSPSFMRSQFLRLYDDFAAEATTAAVGGELTDGTRRAGLGRSGAPGGPLAVTEGEGGLRAV